MSRPGATAPAVLIAGWSMAGCEFEVTASSSHPQSLIGCRLPPTRLSAFGTFAPRRRRRATVTCRLPTPVTRMRRKERSTGPPDADRSVLAPKFVSGARALTATSASTVTCAVSAGHAGAGPPTQCVPEQVSPVVHGLPSSHEALFAACTQPVAVLQESSVHTLPSSQLTAGPATHTRFAQVSLVVHALPSSHAAMLGVCTQPVPESQESSVHTLPSLQLTAAPATHIPLAHTSGAVHALPSSQCAMLKVARQVPAPSQAVSVHGFVSLQGAPAGSNPQVDEQKSPFTVLTTWNPSQTSRMALQRLWIF